MKTSPIFSVAAFALGMLALSSSLSSQTTGPELVRAYTSLGSNLGSEGLVASTAPGLNEIFLNASDQEYQNFWYSLEFKVLDGTFVQTFASHTYESDMVFLGLADAAPTPGDEILIVLENGEIHVHNQLTKALLRVVSTPVEQVTAFGLADFDNDGNIDFAMLGAGGVHFFTSAGGHIATIDGLTGTSLVIGQMDADSSLELAVNSGKVIDVDTGVVQCDWPSGFGFDMALSDFDQDGMQELIFSDEWYFAWAFDVDLCIPKWSLAISNTNAMYVGDSNQDGMDELVIGMAQAGAIRAYNLDTQVEIWSLSTSDRGISAILFADFDQNGVNEILWGAGARSTGEDHLLLGNYSAETVIWESLDLRGPFFGPVLADVDGDGISEIVSISTSSNSYSDGPKIVVLEADSFDPVVSQEIASFRVVDMAAFDLDQDGIDNIVIAGSNLIENYTLQPNGTFIAGTSISSSPFTFESLAVLDINQDGAVEYVVGTAGFGGTFVVTYNVTTGLQELQSVQLGSSFGFIDEIVSGDFDHDGTPELAALVRGGSVYILAPDLSLEETIPGEFVSLSASPNARGGGQDLLVGDRFGNIEAYRWNGSAYTPNGGANLSSVAIDGIGFSPLPHNFIFSSTGGFLQALHRGSGALVWQSDYFGLSFARGIRGDVLFLPNGDFVTSGPTGIYFFRP